MEWLDSSASAPSVKGSPSVGGEEEEVGDGSVGFPDHLDEPEEDLVDHLFVELVLAREEPPREVPTVVVGLHPIEEAVDAGGRHAVTGAQLEVHDDEHRHLGTGGREERDFTAVDLDRDRLADV